MSDQNSRPILKHPAFWGVVIIAALFLFDLFQIKSWLGKPKKRETVNECILKNMKGVQSDVAAREIRKACLQAY